MEASSNSNIQMSSTLDFSVYRKVTVRPLETPTDRNQLELFYLHQLFQLSQHFSRCKSISELVKKAVAISIQELDFDRVGILLLDNAGSHVDGTWGTNEKGELSDESNYHSTMTKELNDIVEQVSEPGKVVIWDDISIVDVDREHLQAEVQHRKVLGRGWNAAYGFWHNRKLLGWIAADNLFRQREFSPLQQQIFCMIGDLLADHIIRIRHQQQLEKLSKELYIQQTLNQKNSIENNDLSSKNKELRFLADHDPLTGLFNRRYFLERLEQELERSMRNLNSFALLMFDIDHFKDVNDEFGHGIGDDVLKVFSSQVLHCLRPHDIFARFGGEEFGLILFDVNESSAVHCSERIRERIECHAFKFENIELMVRCSIGIYLLDQDNIPSIRQLLEYSDQALYQAKNNGRNQSVLYRGE
jgi:diguanylate cyclase (GGDEF)-like protein